MVKIQNVEAELVGSSGLTCNLVPIITQLRLQAGQPLGLSLVTFLALVGICRAQPLLEPPSWNFGHICAANTFDSKKKKSGGTRFNLNFISSPGGLGRCGRRKSC